MIIEGICSECRSYALDLKRVERVLTGGIFSSHSQMEHRCQSCVNKEYFYVDKNGFVKLNRVKVTMTSSIMEEKKQ